MRFLPATFIVLTIATAFPTAVLAQMPSPALQTTVASAPANVQQRRQLLQQKLQQFRDTQKRKTIEAIQTKLATTNKRATDKMIEGMQKVITALTRVKTTRETLIQQGIATTTIDEAILNAEIAITTANAAIASQAAKEYTITINQETTARNDVGLAVSTLRQDLQATHTLAVDAKQAVYKAAMEAKKLQPAEKAASAAAQ